MRMQSVRKLLREFGLTDKQAVTYLAVLQLGTSTIREISKSSELPRSTLYEVADQLVEKGLLLGEGKGWGRRYSAADPKQLRLLLEQKTLALEEALPDLTKLFALGPSGSSVQQAQSRAAIRALYSQVLEETGFNDFYLILTDLTRWSKLDRKFFSEFAVQRTKKIRGTKLLSTACPEAYARFEQGENIRLLPESMNVEINLIITPHQVILHQMAAPEHAVRLSGGPLIDMHRQLFEMIWSMTKRPERHAARS